MKKINGEYKGRFAPSPTGPLHFGSLVTAVASFIDAKSKKGRWFVRIEDIDTPREQPGAKEAILSTLDSYGLWWDGMVLYQSKREEIYKDYLQKLNNMGLTYLCTCSRKRLKTIPNHYDNLCRDRSLVDEEAATRIISNEKVFWDDGVQGAQCFDLSKDGDFIIRRKGGGFSYQLAVSIDDCLQSITNVVRGVDLIETTGRQKHLMKCFDYQSPHYAHMVLFWVKMAINLASKT